MSLHDTTRRMVREAAAQDAIDRRRPPEPLAHPALEPVGPGEIRCPDCVLGLVEAAGPHDWQLAHEECGRCRGTGCVPRPLPPPEDPDAREAGGPEPSAGATPARRRT